MRWMSWGWGGGGVKWWMKGLRRVLMRCWVEVLKEKWGGFLGEEIWIGSWVGLVGWVMGRCGVRLKGKCDRMKWFMEVFGGGESWGRGK